ncbi:MAG: DUF881 domain-containing protein [Peptostreptococcaceae bacterium]|nr:DUF881 domain-containing protein [Peptostreptococcaceae bacterium]
MKLSSKILFALALIFVGTAIGIQLRSPYQMSGYGTVFNRQLISKINKERIDIYDLEKQKRKVNREIKDISKVASWNNEDIARYKDKVDNLEKSMGYSSLRGPGIVMSIDGYEEYNIAYLMEEKKFLILLINELKSREAEAISINGQRISPFSEITLAGSHININFKAIAQPYEIKVIGDSEGLFSYMDRESPIVDVMRRSYGLKIHFRPEEELTIKALEKHKTMENIVRSEI